MYEGPNFSYLLLCFLKAIPVDVKCYLTVVFICIFHMPSDPECFTMCLLVI